MKTKCTNIENNKNITSDHDTKQDQTGTPKKTKKLQELEVTKWAMPFVAVDAWAGTPFPPDVLLFSQVFKDNQRVSKYVNDGPRSQSTVREKNDFMATSHLLSHLAKEHPRPCQKHHLPKAAHG